MATILIVDDRPDARLYLVTVLRHAGHHVFEAGDGQDALAVMEAHVPELVVTDILMPRMDGFEFIRQMRRRPETGNTPVILYTSAYDEDATRDLAAQCRGVRILSKPSEPAHVLQVIHTILADSSKQFPQLGENFHDAHLELLTTQLHEKVIDLERVNADLVAHEASLTETVSQLRALLTERTVLLKEVHHRVKNNLAVIAGLLNMQADATSSAEAQKVLERSHRRVSSMAMVHEHLYSSERLDRINFCEYVEDLVNNLYGEFISESKLVKVRLELEQIELSVDQAIPCGLILNELLSNALRYGFAEGEAGNVLVTFRRQASKILVLTVHDNGARGAGNTGLDKARSLGLQIAEILTHQLGGVLDVQQNSGTRFELTFESEVAPLGE